MVEKMKIALLSDDSSLENLVVKKCFSTPKTNRRFNGQSSGAGAICDEVLQTHGVLFAQFVSVGLVHQILLLLRHVLEHWRVLGAEREVSVRLICFDHLRKIVLMRKQELLRCKTGCLVMA